VPFVLFFECSEEAMTARIMSRGQTSGRVDDNLESAKKRFRTFREQSMPVVEIFEKEGRVKRISALPPPDEVFSGVRELFAPKEVVFVLGGPGSGKGTQCARIVEEFGFEHLSAGTRCGGDA